MQGRGYGEGGYGEGGYGGYVLTMFVGVMTEHAPHYHPLASKHDPIAGATEVALGLAVVIVLGQKVFFRLMDAAGKVIGSLD